MKIVSVKEEDHGDVICTVRSVAGQVSATASLQVVGRYSNAYLSLSIYFYVTVYRVLVFCTRFLLFLSLGVFGKFFSQRVSWLYYVGPRVHIIL